MVLILADSRKAERCLQKLVVLSEKLGARFSDDLVVKCVDGALSIEAPRESVGSVLMRLPWDCFVPTEPFRLAVANDEIVISSHDEGLTSECVACMEAFLELYNLTNKIAEHRRASVWTLIAAYPASLNYLARGQDRRDFAVFGNFIKSGGHENELMLYSFLRSRAYNYEENQQLAPFQVLLPMIELMNHHFEGATFVDDRHHEDRSVSIRRSAPLPQMGNECFACYGPYDTFETWISHAFVDDSAPFVSSIAMTIDLPDLGSIRVANSIKTRAVGNLPEPVRDLHFFIPKLLARTGNHIAVASLPIPGPRAPRALRRTLRFLINGVSPGHPRQDDLVMQAEEQIIAANKAYYEKLAAFLPTLSPTDPVQQGILTNFIRVCNLQLSRIRDYAVYAN